MMLSRRSLVRLACSTAALVATSVAAHAQVATYTDRSTFISAIGLVYTVEDFTGDPHFGYFPFLNSTTADGGLSAGEIRPGVTYSIGTGNMTIDDGSGAGFDGGFLDGPEFSGWDALGPMTATFDAPVRGFGFLTNNFAFATTLTVEVFRGAVSSGVFSFDISGASISSPPVFFGLTDDLGITSATIESDDAFYSFAVDDFTFGGSPTVVGTPEPATITLFATGLIGIGGFAGRRRKIRQK
jgi:PEP-CTERM motif-containing protein